MNLYSKFFFATICRLLLFYAPSLYALQSFIVPFLNVRLIPNQQLSAFYQFGKFHIIFCYDNSLKPLASIQWNYLGVPQRNAIPIFLKTAAQYQGSFADPVGYLQIRNLYSADIIVSCVFGI